MPRWTDEARQAARLRMIANNPAAKGVEARRAQSTNRYAFSELAQILGILAPTFNTSSAST